MPRMEMDKSRVIERVEQPHAWTFHAIHTPEHVNTVIMHGGYCYSFMRIYPILITQRICCICIDCYGVLALVSHVKTSILTIT